MIHELIFASSPVLGFMASICHFVVFLFNLPFSGCFALFRLV